jgi:HJR/Mrr/RecB family endonuclease
MYLVIFLLLYYLFKREFRVKKKFKKIELMNEYEFEEYLSEVFKELGYKVKRTKFSNDQGTDLLLSKQGFKTVVQTKKYSYPVSNKSVQEVISAKQFYGCDRAIVVTNSIFTRSAKELAKKCRVKLWNGRF